MRSNRLGSLHNSRSVSATGQQYAVRMCLLGEAGAGKSNLFHRIKYKKFKDDSDEATNSLGITTGLTARNRSYDSHTVVLRSSKRKKKISLTLMDTASRERYQSLTAQYYRGAHVVLLVCSLDSEYTLTRLAKWHQEAQYYVDESEVIYALVATKSDLEEVEREVSREMLLGFSSHYGVEEARVFEISSKTGEGVDDMLQTLAETVVEQFERGSTSLNIRSGSVDERTTLLGSSSRRTTSVSSPLSSMSSGASETDLTEYRKPGCCSNCVIL
ncbi:ras-related protein Rab-4A-like [Halichondria panicea]|uniref:ras-related protein Rab-4A-like n=1 Tax=Halichondria panicea TaxID=6063 RepID=UPI00312B40C9